MQVGVHVYQLDLIVRADVIDRCQGTFCKHAYLGRDIIAVEFA